MIKVVDDSWGGCDVRENYIINLNVLLIRTDVFKGIYLNIIIYLSDNNKITTCDTIRLLSF